jgi:hypothetical protein
LATSTATLWSTGNVGNGPGAIAWQLGDVNGDGRPELIQLWNNKGRLGMIVYHWNGNAMVTLWGNPNVGQGVGAINWEIGDVNGDQRRELIQLWSDDGRLGAIVYGWNGASMATLSAGDVMQGPNAVDWQIGDVNGDGFAEILQACSHVPARHLGLREEKQQQSEWCWSASTVSITLFFDPAATWTQCKLVNRALSKTNCCADGSTSACNQPWYADQALTITGHLASSQEGKPAFARVRSEIDAGHPVSVNVQWTGGGGHNPVVDGYDATDPAAPTIDVQDSGNGHSIVDFNSFPASYHAGGTWAASYFTQ